MHSSHHFLVLVIYRSPHARTTQEPEVHYLLSLVSWSHIRMLNYIAVFEAWCLTVNAFSTCNVRESSKTHSTTALGAQGDGSGAKWWQQETVRCPWPNGWSRGKAELSFMNERQWSPTWFLSVHILHPHHRFLPRFPVLVSLQILSQRTRVFWMSFHDCTRRSWCTTGGASCLLGSTHGTQANMSTTYKVLTVICTYTKKKQKMQYRAHYDLTRKT